MFLLSFLIILCLLIYTRGNKHLYRKVLPNLFCINAVVELYVIYSCLFKKKKSFPYKCYFFNAENMLNPYTIIWLKQSFCCFCDFSMFS